MVINTNLADRNNVELKKETVTKHRKVVAELNILMPMYTPEVNTEILTLLCMLKF